VNRLLDLDTDREVAFSLVSIGRVGSPPPPAPQEIPKLDLPTIALSKREVDYPELREIHTASSLESVEEVSQWRTRSLAGDDSARVRDSFDVESDAIEQVILRRGSSRRFQRASISLDQLSIILRASTRGIWPGQALLNDLYLIVNSVEGLDAGAYFYHAGDSRLELLKAGDFRNEAQYLGLQQNLPGDASANVFFLADLHRIFDRFGNRGYRTVQLEAGILGGKMYLGAYAQHLGATGLTFFDDDVIEFFSPHAKDKSAIFLVALGKGRKLE
jgi:SagB-type dehydrogenase family enzyme